MSPERPSECIHGLHPQDCVFCRPKVSLPRQEFQPPLRRRRKRSVPRRPDGLYPVNHDNDISNIPRDVTAIHLAGQPSAALIEEIIERHPELKTIQFSPSNFDRVVARNRLIAALAEEHELTLLRGPQGKQRQNLDQRHDPDFSERQNYLRFRLKPPKIAILRDARERGFDEAEMLWRYFCLERPLPPRISLMDLAQEFGFPYRSARSRIMGLLSYLGCPNVPSDNSVYHAAKSFATRYRAAQRPDPRIQFETYQPLPDKLHPGQWENFLALTRTTHNEPERYQEFQDTWPQMAEILDLYFGLSGPCYSNREIGEQQEVTRQTIRRRKNKALSILGILDG